MATVFAIFFGIFLFLVTLFLFWRMYSTQQKMRKARRTVEKILKKAIDSPIDVRIDKKVFSGFLRFVSDKVIYIEIKIPTIYQSSSVTCFICTTDASDTTYYWFTSIFEEYDENTKYARLTLPARVSLGEKRLFLRATPPQKSVNMLGLWKVESGLPLPQKKPTSQALYMAKAGDTHFSISNISASGVALITPLETQLIPGDAVLFFIGYTYKNTPHLLWIAGDILHVRMHEHNTIVSIKFTCYGEISDMEESIPWTLCRDDVGISAISKWIGE